VSLSRSRYFIRRSEVQDILDRHHLTHREFAESIGMPQSYWSSLFNRRHALTPRTRRLLLTAPCFVDASEADLWEVVRDAEGGEQ